MTGSSRAALIRPIALGEPAEVKNPWNLHIVPIAWQTPEVSRSLKRSPFVRVHAPERAMNLAAWAGLTVDTEYMPQVLHMGETQHNQLLCFPANFIYGGASQNRSESGGMPERASHGFETIPVVARLPCGTEWCSPPSGRRVKEPDLGC